MAILSSEIVTWHDFQNTATDSAGNYNATVTNATFQTGTKLSANFSHALSFDGTGDYFTLGDITQIKGASAFTISAWIYNDDVTNQMFWATDDIGTADSIQAFIQNSGGPIRLAVKSVNNRGDLAIAGNMSTGTWYHMVQVYDGTQSTNATKLRLWLNNSEKTLSYTGTIETTSSTGDNFYFGFRETGGTGVYDYDGVVQQLVIIDRAIDSTEISSLYASGSGVTYSSFFGGGGSSIKTFNGLAYASTKTVNGLAIASVKTKNGLA